MKENGPGNFRSFSPEPPNDPSSMSLEESIIEDQQSLLTSRRRSSFWKSYAIRNGNIYVIRNLYQTTEFR